MATMKKNLSIIATAIILVIATILTICLLRGEEEVYIPEGSLMLGDGMFIPPEDFIYLEQMSEVFLRAMPFEGIGLSPLVDFSEDEIEFILKDTGKQAAARMYMAGIRELREIVLLEIIGIDVDMRAVDSNGVIYYIQVFGGNIRLVTKSSPQGEILFDNRRW